MANMQDGRGPKNRRYVQDGENKGMWLGITFLAVLLVVGGLFWGLSKNDDRTAVNTQSTTTAPQPGTTGSGSASGPNNAPITTGTGNATRTPPASAPSTQPQSRP